MEQQPKWLLQSKTFVGVAISAVGGFASAFGWDWWGAVSGDITQAVNMVLTLFGTLWAIYGRIKAQGPATVTKPASNA